MHLTYLLHGNITVRIFYFSEVASLRKVLYLSKDLKKDEVKIMARPVRLLGPIPVPGHLGSLRRLGDVAVAFPFAGSTNKKA